MVENKIKVQLKQSQIQHVVLAPASLTFMFEIVLFQFAPTTTPHLRLISTGHWFPISFLISSQKSRTNSGSSSLTLGRFIHPDCREEDNLKDKRLGTSVALGPQENQSFKWRQARHIISIPLKENKAGMFMRKLGTPREEHVLFFSLWRGGDFRFWQYNFLTCEMQHIKSAA